MTCSMDYRTAAHWQNSYLSQSCTWCMDQQSYFDLKFRLWLGLTKGDVIDYSPDSDYKRGTRFVPEDDWINFLCHRRRFIGWESRTVVRWGSKMSEKKDPEILLRSESYNISRLNSAENKFKRINQNRIPTLINPQAYQPRWLVIFIRLTECFLCFVIPIKFHLIRNFVICIKGIV